MALRCFMSERFKPPKSAKNTGYEMQVMVAPRTNSSEAAKCNRRIGSERIPDNGRAQKSGLSSEKGA